jgi:NAD(P)-dependent dehydrogenase (short-subunit alcohol dehydrogenase family)/uncharacterized OB-fold protein
MSPFLDRPPRKNPVLRTRAAVLPPGRRSRVALAMTAAAAEGRFALQVCVDCCQVQYPPREACQHCLGTRLRWREQDGRGELIAATELAHSNDLYFRQRLPWRLGLIGLDAGPQIVAHLHSAVGRVPARVRVTMKLDKAGQGVLVGIPEKDTSNMTDDSRMRELTCDPTFRKILIADGKSAVGQALARAFIAAGADLVWLGVAEPWKKFPGMDDVLGLPQVTVVPLDVTDGKSVHELAHEIGGRVDILVNNSDFHRNDGIASRAGTEFARMEMDVNYFGLLRLAQEFGPAMRSRAADGASSAVAWVNILSIFSLANFPLHGTYSASKAAELSLAQCLRAEMRGAAIRVLNVFPGPIDDEWHQLIEPPKLSPEALAKMVAAALRDGVEDLYPGDVAQEWRAKWLEDPRVLEREVTL